MKRVVAFFAILALFATHGFTAEPPLGDGPPAPLRMEDRKSTRLNSSH